MEKILHILRTQPDETVEQLIEASAAGDGVSVIGLYDDRLTRAPVDWFRLVDDIFNHDKVICWW